MYLEWILPIFYRFVGSSFWSYIVLPFFCLVLLVVFARLIVNTVRYFSNV